MRALYTIVASLVVSLNPTSVLAQDQAAPDEIVRPLAADWYACDDAARELEAELGTPEHLLSAITLTESGRRAPDRTVKAWPWTINVGGQGYQYATREQAIHAARQLLDRGIRSFDVGCAQINMRYHPRAFTSLEEAFEPRANILYAASFLERLAERHDDWERAVGLYHSYTEEYNILYTGRVETFLDIARRRALNDLDPVELYQGASRPVMNASLVEWPGEAFDALESVGPQDRNAPPTLDRLVRDTARLEQQRLPIVDLVAYEQPLVQPIGAGEPRAGAILHHLEHLAAES